MTINLEKLLLWIIGIIAVSVMLAMLPGTLAGLGSGGGGAITLPSALAFLGGQGYVYASGPDMATYMEEAKWNGVDGVYVDSVNGSAGTTGSIGTPGNPSSNLTDALAIAAARKVTNIYVSNFLTIDIDLPAPTMWRFIGRDDTNMYFSGIDLNGKTIGAARFDNIFVYGDSSLATNLEFRNCGLGVSHNSGTLTFDCFIENSFGGVDVKVNGLRMFGGWFESPVFHDFTSSVGGSSYWHVSGNLTITNHTVAILTPTYIYGSGLDLTIDASCTGGTINIYGDVTVTDNSTGTVVNDNSLQHLISP